MAYMNIDYTYTKIHTLQLEQNYLFRLYATEELLGAGIVIRVNSQGIEMSIAVVISPLPNFLINQDTTLADILDLMHCVLGREQAHREKDKDTSNKETAHVLGLVGLTPQQQPGSYRAGDDDDEMSVSLVEQTGAPEGNHRPTASN